MGSLAARRQRDARVLALLWLMLAFGLFTAMPTKFHHYIFPALPPAAVLLGAPARRPRSQGAPRLGRAEPALGAAALGGAALVLLVAWDLGRARRRRRGAAAQPRDVQLRAPLARLGSDLRAVFAVAGGVLRPRSSRPSRRRGCGAGRRSRSSARRRRSRCGGSTATSSASAPHWGQRDLVEAYYRARGSEADPLAAFNLNWKGENFYTGNRVAVFPAGGKITHVDRGPPAGGRAVRLLPHGAGAARYAAQGAGGPAGRSKSSPERKDNNKFVLVRVTYE